MKNKLIVLCPAHDVLIKELMSLNIGDRYDLYLFYEEKYKSYKKSDKIFSF